MKIVRNTFILFFFLLPYLSFAESNNISNVIETSANTGNNSASNGEVVEGKSESTIKIKTVINGEVMEDSVEHSTDGSLEKTSTYKSDSSSGEAGGKTYIETHIETTQKTGEENKPEVLESASSTEKGEGVEVEKPKRSFKELIKRIFKNVFSIFKI